MQLVAPIVGEVSSGGDRGAFMSGYMKAQQQTEDKKQQDAQMAQRTAASGANYLMDVTQHAQGITDPVDFQNFVDMAQQAGEPAGYVKPGQLRSTLKFSNAKAAEAQLKELTDQLDQLDKGGYDLDQLAAAGSSLHLKSGKTIPIGTALDLTRQRPTDPTGAAIPKPKKADTAASTDFGRFLAKFAKDKGKTVDTLTTQDELAAKDQFAQAGRPPIDPTLEALRKAQLANALRGGGDEPIQPDDVQGAAQAILSGRMAPSQLSLVGGMGNRGVKFKQAVVAAVNKQDPAFNWQSSEAGFKFGSATGTQNTVRYMDSVQESMPRVLASAQTLGNGNVRSLNALINAGKSQINNVDLKAFQSDVILVADEIAKILQGGGTGSGTSDAKLRQASTILSSSDSPAAIAAALTEVNTLIGYRKENLTKGTFLAPKPGAVLRFNPATGKVE